MIAAIGAGREDRVLDVATGTGLVARGLVERYGCAVVGLDQSRDMLAGARRALAGAPQLAARIDLVQGEAERLPFDDGEFDHLTFTYLLRYVDDPAATLAELARVVKAGGRIPCLGFGLPHPPPWRPPVAAPPGGVRGGGQSACWGRRPPAPPLWRPLWRLYTRLVLPAAGRGFGTEWYEVGRFLGPSIEELYSSWPIERQLELWRAAGISAVRVRRMSLGGGVVFSGVRDG